MKIKLKNIFVVLVVLSFIYVGNAQKQRTDSVGNFYVIGNHLMWQKTYSLDDENELNDFLKKNHFTSNLDILDYKTSAMSNVSYLDGVNLPQYTSKGFKAFIIIDIINDKYRVTVRDIKFPDFIQTSYYNGWKDEHGGTFDHYILRRSDFEIKRNSGTYNILEVFDGSFDASFNLNSDF